MKLNILGIGFIAMFFLFAFSASAQATGFVGNWQSTAPVASMNNSIVKIKVLSTSDPAVFIIINSDNPKKKFVSKYDQATNRLYTTIKNQSLYFAYVSTSDMLECYKTTNNSKIADLTRF